MDDRQRQLGEAVAQRDWVNGVTRYPDPAVEVVDDSFRKYINANAALERLWTGARWTEGPVWFGDRNCLLFSDIPNNRIMCWHALSGQTTVYREPSNNTNGHTRDREGRLVSCEHRTRRVTRTEHDGSVTVLADAYQGKRLNAPNDVVVKSDGSVWFTDPGYGILHNYEGGVAESELPTNVYRLDPLSGRLEAVVTDFAKPNGLCFSPDESLLYISDTATSHDPDGNAHIRVFEVDGDSVRGGREFVDMRPAVSDGFRADMDGNIWTSSGWAGPGLDGVQVFNPTGDLIGRIHLPEICANVCFGGPHRNRLFMMGSQSVYHLWTEAIGAQTP